MKKLLYGTTALVAAGMVAGGAQAADKIKVGVGGYFYGYLVGVDQDDSANTSGTNPDPGNNRRGHHINREGEIIFTGKTTLDNGIQFGVQVQLEAETCGDQIDESFMWMSGSFGKINLGSENAASYLMGYGSVAASHWSAGVNSPGSRFHTTGGNAAGFNTTNAQLTSDAEKITYFTPRMSGFQLGVSYTPERAQDIASYAGPAGNADAGDQSEVVEIGANWTGKMGGTSVGVSGSWGEASEEVSSAAGDDREEYTLGMKASMNNITVGFRFNNDNQGTSGGNTDREAWQIGVRYKSGPWGMGVQIANNEVGQGAGAGNDEARAIEIGGSYSIGPGITMVGGVQVHDLSDSAGDPAQENEATVFFIGTFLGF
jgi:predicted porin